MIVRRSRRRCRTAGLVVPRAACALEPLDPRRLLSTYFVDDNSPNPAGGDGLSWGNAFGSLQAALAAAQAGDEIRVGQGTYKPTAGTDATVSFVLKSGVSVVGGYAGYGHATPDARDVAAYGTHLSGDIGTVGVKTDNSHHVVVASGTDATAVLDGFTITGGFAVQEANGGGMYNVGGSPTVRRCAFVANTAEYGRGGAVYNYNGARPTFADCTFAQNYAYRAGGAVYSELASAATFTNCKFLENRVGPNGQGFGGAVIAGEGAAGGFFHCTFAANSAGYSGGAIEVRGRALALTISDCTFTGNDARSFGGAVQFGGIQNTADIARCTFVQNVAGNYGGALGLNAIPANITDCTFTRNDSWSGGAIYNWASASVISNCLFERNEGEEGGAIHQSSSSPTMSLPPKFRDCVFRGNVAASGGAIYYGGYDSVTTNCLFVGNRARYGGALDLYYAYPTIANCTIVANVAEYWGGGLTTWDAQGSLANCVIWGNSAPTDSQLRIGGATTTSIKFSDVQGGFAGAGNVNVDPKFAAVPSPGPDGVWTGAANDDDYGDLRLAYGSPVVDAGSNAAVPAGVTTDLAGAARVFDFPGVNNAAGAVVDMGAYELGSTLALLHVPDGQTLNLPAGGRTYVVEQLSIGTNATLNLADNDLIIDYTDVSSVDGMTSLIATGRNGGAWNGQGLVTSMADAKKELTTLAIAESAHALAIGDGESAVWNGHTVDATAVLIKYTYAGDTDLDGDLDADDYGTIDFAVLVPGATGYYNGDFNYDGVVDADDYGFIDFNILVQTGRM